MIRGVTFDDCFQSWIEVTQDRGRSKGLFEFIKASLVSRSPVELGVLPEEIEEQTAFSRVTLDKTPVEVREAQEALYIMYILRSFPVKDSLDLSRVHLHTITADNESKKGCLGNDEVTLFTFDA